MATAQIDTEEDEPDYFYCSVCLEHMKHRKPRFLKCHHSFCESCLLRLVNQGKIKCPSCRAVTNVTNNDVQTLVMNFQLLQFMEEDKPRKVDAQKKDEQTQLKEHINTCQFCKESPATKICDACTRILCEACATQHDKMARFKDHKVLPLCEEHHEGILHFCMKCVKPVCVTCMVRFHSDHEDRLEEYEGYVDKVKEELSSIKSNLKMGVATVQKWKVEDMQKKRDTIELKKLITERRKYFLAMVTQANAVLSEIENNYETKVGDILEVYGKIEADCEDMVNRLEKVQQCKDSEFMDRYAPVKQSAEKYMTEMKNRKVERYQLPPYKVSSKDVPSIAQRVLVTETPHGYMQFCPSVPTASQANKEPSRTGKQSLSSSDKQIIKNFYKRQKSQPDKQPINFQNVGKVTPAKATSKKPCEHVWISLPDWGRKKQCFNCGEESHT